ncbi:hypothetical protein GCM10023205_19740 [Yinghuangia aomiensis]|uniref:Protein kinase domain-containing protein n=2 Tax=Yinghuangia aomiensis TaxID=676205 RepID=A0ABP9H071_9ACTN
MRDGDPRSLGGYTLLGRIGAGGMGEVFLGQSPAGQLAAVKVIKSSVLDDDARNRFVSEVDSLKTVYGAGVAAFLGGDPHADQPWLAVEYVHGPDLRSHVSRHGTLPLVETASLGAMLAEATSTVHEAGLLHRDLKPQNILLAEYGPKIIDFGLAVLTQRRGTLTASGFVVGSIVCMPPEQARGDADLTPAADVYALGAVLLYAATGHYPYEGETWQAIALRIEDPRTPPNLGGLPSPLHGTITAMLAYEPDARPTLAGVTRDLVDVIEQAGSNAAQAKRLLAGRSAAERDVMGLPQEKPRAEDAAPLVYTPDIIDPAADDATAPVSVVDVLGPHAEEPAARWDAGRGDGPTPRDVGVLVGSGVRSGTRLDLPLRIAERMRAAYARDGRF